jgi:hypothetical protein
VTPELHLQRIYDIAVIEDVDDQVRALNALVDEGGAGQTLIGLLWLVRWFAADVAKGQDAVASGSTMGEVIESVRQWSLDREQRKLDHWRDAGGDYDPGFDPDA